MSYNRYCIKGILRDVVSCVALDDEQIAIVLEKLERDRQRDEIRKAYRKKQKESFEQEIIKILQKFPDSGFTATDVQFLIDDFMYRRISNQKVSSYLSDMNREGKISSAVVNGKRTVYFLSGTLKDGYAFPIYRVDHLFLKKEEN